ncbi:MAG TPA: Na+/H+ antiporter subunit E [Candidatus Tectomicrobia bacterium]|nr:Na+/H+ antiporter subunit E [Candidatus Tectomicrobia bacterium]
MIRAALGGGGLVAVYLLVLGRASAWDAVVGALVAASVLGGFRRFLRETAPGPPPAGVPELLGRAAALPVFVLAVVREIARGSARVAAVVLGVGAPASPGVVEIPLEGRTPRGVAVAALVTTMAPGSVLLDVDRRRNVMRIQTLDADDPDAVRRHEHDFYRRYQSRVFP